MKKLGFLVVVCFSFLVADIAFSGTWLGSNLALNGDFESGLSSWQQIGRWETRQYSNTTTHYAIWTGGTVGQLRQTVVVENGKRYRLYGRGAGASAQVIASNVVSLPGWLYYSSISSAPYQSAIGIALGNQSEVVLYGSSTGGYDLKFDHIQLQQVVYDPQIDISENEFLSETTTVSLTLQDLSFADTPTSWYIDWGDGAIDYNPTLNSLAEHTYDISGGITDYTATFYGENQAGNMMDTVAITVVPEPMTFVLFLGSLSFIRKKRKM